ncbi:hypothetical protein IGL98_000661 [Enterococcus sp. DIV0840]|uniref:F0F1 ATP synthase subunit delta n=1 Tax=Enterococcus TaxID=1350 RepID=UPI001A9049EC|nr:MULTISPECIES: F0F1 ATP synthase subunit delta [Enterococcus]MBO0434607.1 hypothetical protein [Enterococcus sp. DIV0849a]MBO0472175.1 hypothetical protein [Enterococcus ureasiticus]
MNSKIAVLSLGSTQLIETIRTTGEATLLLVQSFFTVVIESARQLLMLVLTIVPFILAIVALCFIVWQLIEYSFKFFDSLDRSLREDKRLEQEIDAKVSERKSKEYEQEKRAWSKKFNQMVEARDYYQTAFEQLSDKNEEKKYDNHELFSPVVQKVAIKVPDEALTKVLYKTDMKAQMKSVFKTVEEVEAEQLYQEAIEKFNYDMLILQTRYALPYKVIIRLFELYNEDELKTFYQSFNFFMKELSLRKHKKIYRSNYYSSEQKMQIFSQLGLLDSLDKEFCNFLYFLLNKYSYRQTNELHQHFQKVWGIRYYQGTITVSLPSETEISLFKEVWAKNQTSYQLEITIQPEVKKGVIIHSAQTSVDLSYQKLIDQYVDRYEMEVSL